MENLKLKKAEDLYLRGFKGYYIKKNTGFSIQSLLKTLKSKGVVYNKSDILEYQLNYIQNKYCKEDVISAYKYMSNSFVDLEKSSNKKEIFVLGCCFGRYKPVFVKILGEQEYNNLKNSCWKKKQNKKVKEIYGVENFFMSDDFKHPMHDSKIKEKRRQTMLTRYGVEQPNQNLKIKKKMMHTFKSTMNDRYGVDYPTEVPEIAQKVSESRQNTMLLKYGAKNSVQVKEIRNKIFESRKKNNTLNSSKAEEFLYDMLVGYFGYDDVFRNEVVDNRYPFHVDFYIKSRDLFIELNGDKCHYTHWFDETNPKDLQVLESWKQNANRIFKETGNVSRYTKYIETWTVSDVKKRNFAKNNNLNYLVFWDGSRRIKINGVEYPRLEDVNDWFDSGCPDSKHYKKENTY